MMLLPTCCSTSTPPSAKDGVRLRGLSTQAKWHLLHSLKMREAVDYSSVYAVGSLVSLAAIDSLTGDSFFFLSRLGG